MKKIFLSVMLLAMGLAMKGQVTYQADDYWLVGRLYYHITSDSTVEVVPAQNCDVYPREIEVPAQVVIEGREYAVTRIGDGAFANLCTVNSITLPSTLEEIGKEAFESFSADVVLPESLRKIEFGAFAYARLREMHIPCNVEQIDEVAFCGSGIMRFTVDTGNRHYVAVDSLALCSRDTALLLAFGGTVQEVSYDVPQPVRRIAASAFYGSVALRTVNLPEGLREIGGSAFGIGLTGLYIPASVSRIEGVLRDTAPAGFALTIAPGNRHYRMEDGRLMSYDGDTLVMWLGAAGDVQVPSGVRVLGGGVFQYNTRVTHVYLPEGLTEIGEGAFAVSSADVSLPTTLVSMGEQAFYGNTGTSRISIPRLTHMGSRAFQFSAITTVDSALQLQVIPKYAFSDSPLNSFKWGERLEVVDDYAFYAVPMSVGAKVMPASLRKIGISAFSTRNRVRSFTFLGAVDSIGEYALRCRVIKLRDPHVPAIHITALRETDSVYTPCGMVEEFENAIEHENGTAFAEWCEVGIGEAEGMEDMLLYPNPARESVVLKGLPESGAEVTVRDLVGRVVLCERLQGTAARIDTRRLAGGVYLLTAATEGGCRTLRLVVE